MKNYKVACLAFGEYPRGTVLPEFRVALAGPVGDLVGRGTVEPTDEPVTAGLTFEADLARAHPDVPVAGLDEARAELAALRESHGLLTAAHAEGQRQAEALTKQLSLHVTELDRLKALYAQAQADRDGANAKAAELTAANAKLEHARAEAEKLLEQATSPAK